MKILKTSLLFIFVLILTASFTPAKKKFVYSPAGGNFSVTFPAEYTTETDEGENVTTYKTSCSIDGQTYFASYSVHEVEIVDHMEMAEVSYDSFIQAVGGELHSKTEWEIKGHTGLIAVMDLPDNEIKLEYRVILVGDIQYQLVAMAAYQNWDDKTASKFFKSFKLM